MAMTLVATATVGADGASSIQFIGIPQNGKDLLLFTSLRSSTASNGADITLNGNSVQGRYIFGTGTTVSSFISSGLLAVPSTHTASTFSNTACYISNYTTSGTKSVSVDGVQENNATATAMGLAAQSSSSAPAVTSLSINPETLFVQGSTASLYIIS